MDSLVPAAFGALEGLKIVSTGTLIAAPFAAHLAAGCGAEVIQIEHPSGTVDPWRRVGATRVTGDDGTQVSAAFVQERRNAFYITLDLSTPEGQVLLLRLLRRADIWLESSKPGTCQNWGLTDERVLEANPALVVTHVSGYGQTGHADYLGRASYDMIAQAFGGLMFLTGQAEPEPPMRATPFTGDYLTAYQALWSSLAAYIHRLRTGRGQVLDVTQFETVHQGLGGAMVEWFKGNHLRRRTGNRATELQPYDAFRAIDGWVALGAAPGPIFARLCRVVGLDPEEWSAASLDLHSPLGLEFDERLSAWIAERSVADVVTAMNAARVSCSAVMSSRDMAEDPHFCAREVHVEWDDLQVGRVKGTGVLPKFSETPGMIWRGSVPVGHDNALVYGDMLQIPPDQLTDLAKRGVV
jgi:crotonobetainyl-CoA:carnitine CoA-transferase CaiB-like acyl-CoA transferase